MRQIQTFAAGSHIKVRTLRKRKESRKEQGSRRAAWSRRKGKAIESMGANGKRAIQIAMSQA